MIVEYTIVFWGRHRYEQAQHHGSTGLYRAKSRGGILMQKNQTPQPSTCGSPIALTSFALIRNRIASNLDNFDTGIPAHVVLEEASEQPFSQL